VLNLFHFQSAIHAYLQRSGVPGLSIAIGSNGRFIYKQEFLGTRTSNVSSSSQKKVDISPGHTLCRPAAGGAEGAAAGPAAAPDGGFGLEMKQC
ncbi:MAG: hypothetical protein AAF349_23220, partial [Cyanobacteria bacterium P01_A01_bin.68]